jgi:GTP-binding protein EngB required for normal cell division
MGEAKRGKSSLINALVGRDLLPTGIVPVTAVQTTVRPGEADAATVVYADGRREACQLDRLADFVSEDRNAGNERGVAEVTVSVPLPQLPPNLEIIDTPGTGSWHAAHEQVAEEATDAMDIAVVVIGAEPPMSANEVRLVQLASERAVRVHVVLGKADRLSDEEQVAAAGYAATVAARVLGSAVDVLPVSPLRARRDPLGDAGMDRLRRQLLDEEVANGRGTLTESLRRRAHRLAVAARDEASLTAAVLRLDAEHDQLRRATFEGALDQVPVRRREATDRAVMGIKHLVDDVNATVDQIRPRLQNEVSGVVDRADPGLAPRSLEQQVRDEVAGTCVALLEPFRARLAEAAERGLVDLAERCAGPLAEAVEDVRAAAREQLGVELAIPMAVVELPDPGRFFYLLTPDVSAAEVVDAVVRRALPGRWGRQVLLAHLREEAATTAERQLGRVRADLQARLTDAGRALQRALREAFDTTFDQLDRVTRESAHLSRSNATRTAESLAEAQVRVGRLETVVAELVSLEKGAS